LTVTGSQATAALGAFRGESPQMSLAAAPILKTADRRRMGAALSWLRHQARDGQHLALASDAQAPATELRRPVAAEPVDPDVALGLPSSESRGLDAADVLEAAVARAQALEQQVFDLLQRSPPPTAADAVSVADDSAAVELAATAIAVSYAAREQSDLMRSSLEVAGGLQLPASVAVIAHAYAQADKWFW
jgi:hypothetical protein